MDAIPFHFGEPLFVDFFLGAGTYPQPSFLSVMAGVTGSGAIVATPFTVYDAPEAALNVGAPTEFILESNTCSPVTVRVWL
jgi:hypothetical protein